MTLSFRPKREAHTVGRRTVTAVFSGDLMPVRALPCRAGAGTSSADRAGAPSFASRAAPAAPARESGGGRSRLLGLGFVQRWRVEVTFEEVRAYLGVETQRQRSGRAIARTAPVLMRLRSLVALIAHRLQRHHSVPIRANAWCAKLRPTFGDALALV